MLYKFRQRPWRALNTCSGPAPSSGTTSWFLTNFTSSLNHFNGSLCCCPSGLCSSTPATVIQAEMSGHALLIDSEHVSGSPAFRVKAKVLTVADSVLGIWPLFMALILSPSALPCCLALATLTLLLADPWTHFFCCPRAVAPSAWNALCPESAVTSLLHFYQEHVN